MRALVFCQEASLSKSVMIKVFIALLLSISLSCGHKPASPKEIKSPIEQQHSTTHRVAVFDKFSGETGHCSGTAIGPHALLTAQHCFQDSNLIRLDDDKKATVIVAALIDGNDHVIYILKKDFSEWAEVNQRKLEKNEPVHFWGAPGHSKDVYRTGYFASLSVIEDLDSSFKFQKFILPVFGGDSGSGIFDEFGSVVAVVSMGDKSAEEISEPLQFTALQLDVATAE